MTARIHSATNDVFHFVVLGPICGVTTRRLLLVAETPIVVGSYM